MRTLLVSLTFGLLIAPCIAYGQNGDDVPATAVDNGSITSTKSVPEVQTGEPGEPYYAQYGQHNSNGGYQGYYDNNSSNGGTQGQSQGSGTNNCAPSHPLQPGEAGVPCD